MAKTWASATPLEAVPPGLGQSEVRLIELTARRRGVAQWRIWHAQHNPARLHRRENLRRLEECRCR